MRRRLLGALLLVLLALPTLYVTSGLWMPWALGRALLAAAPDWRIEQLDAQAEGSRTLVIASAAVVRGDGTRARLEDARIGWRWLELARDGRLQAIDITDLHLAFPPRVAPNAPAAPGAAPTPLDPVALLGQLRAERLDIRAFRAELADEATRLIAEGSVRADPAAVHVAAELRRDALSVRMAFTMDSAGVLRLRVMDTRDAQLGLLEGELTSSDDGLHLQGSLRLDAERLGAMGGFDAQGHLTLPLAMTAADGGLRITAGPGMQGGLALDSSAGRLTLEVDETSRLSLEVDPEGQPSGRVEALSGALQAAPWTLRSRIERASLPAAGEGNRLDLQGTLTLDGPVSATGRYRLDWAEDDGTPQLLAGSRLELDRIDLPGGDLAILGASLQTDAPAHLAPESAVALRAERLTLTADALDQGSRAWPMAARLQLEALDMLATGDDTKMSAAWQLALGEALTAKGRLNWAEDTELDIDALEARLHEPPLADLPGLPPDLRLGGRLRASGRLLGHDDIEQAELSGRIEHAMLHRGDVQLRGANSDFRVALDAGRLELRADALSLGELQWKPEAQDPILLRSLTGVVNALADPGDGRLLASTFDLAAGSLHTPWVDAFDLDVEGELAGSADDPYGHLEIGAERLDAGVPARRLTCALTITGARIDTGDCGLEALGGRIDLQEARAELADGTLEARVKLTAIDLGALLALQGQTTLDGSGTLSGELPIRMAAQQLTVSGGQVAADGPGHLAYTDATRLLAATARPELALALRALQDFRYDTLSSQVDYDADGNLDLAIALGGGNPDVEAGRRINFNLNVTQNLPVLLRSLRLSDTLGERIRRRLEERPQP